MIIDPPLKTASTREWTAYLESLRALKPKREFDIEAVESAIRDAETELSQRSQ